MSVGIGTQFTASLAAGQTQTWFTWGWDPNYLVIWSIRPTAQPAQVRLTQVGLEYSTQGVTYWLTIANTGSGPAMFEARYYFKTVIPEDAWRSLGPDHLSGCMIQVAVDPGNSDRIYAVAQGGGLWTLDSVSNYPSLTWEPLSDQHASLAGFAVAIAPSDNSVIYLAEGSSFLRSPDGGSTWAPAAATPLWYGDDPWTHAARRIAVDPRDADRVLLATNSGLWQTTDAGAIWTQLLTGDVTDVALDPADPAIVYAAQRDTGVLKSATGSPPWTTIQPWNAATQVKIALGRQGIPASRTVALKFDQQVMVSHSAGSGPWTSSTLPQDMWNEQQYDWNTCIAVDPFDNQVILAGIQELFRSADGGQTWSMVAFYYHPHEDQQSLAFDPVNRGVVYLSNDGGIWRSTDGGQTWMSGAAWPWNDVFARQDLNFGLTTADFYRVGVGPGGAVGPVAVGPGHHQGLMATPFVKSSEWEGIQGHSWEGANTYAFPNQAGIFYLVQGTDLWRQLYPLTSTPADLTQILPAIGQPHALAMDNRPNSTMLFAGTSAGELKYTLNPAAAQPSWNTVGGVSLNEPIVSIAFAPGTPGMAYLVSVSGKVFRNADVAAPASWTDMTSDWAGGPAVQITVDAVDGNRLYLAASDQIAVSADGGATWQPIAGATSGALGTSYFNSIVAHPVHPGAAFAAGNPGGLRVNRFRTNLAALRGGLAQRQRGVAHLVRALPVCVDVGTRIVAAPATGQLRRGQRADQYPVSATLGPGQGQSWFTWGWPTNWFVVWSVRPLTDGGQVVLDSVDVQLGPPGFTYTLTITNTGTQPVVFEAKYAYVAS